MTAKGAPIRRRYFGVVPAAGLSRRMGRPKLSLPLGDGTVLEQVLRALQPHPLSDLVVVLGPSTERHRSLVAPPARALLLERDPPDMRHSVVAGLREIERRWQPENADGVLLALGDQPAIPYEVAAHLLRASAEDLHSIHVPTHSGKRGHPVLFPWSIVPEILALEEDQGLNQVLRAHPERVREHPVAQGEVLEDLDLPDDYERARRRWES